MSSNEESPSKSRISKLGGEGGPEREGQRRQFLKVAMSLGVVFITAGIASVAKSLFAPSAAPPNPPASSSTKTVTKTVTSTVGGTQTGAASAGSSVTSTSQSTSASSTSSSPFPAVVVANIADLASGKPISFNYPLEETPNILVKLGAKAQGGVGPDEDIVAFSEFCQHLGCVFGFVPAGAAPACDHNFNSSSPVGYCCCHGSSFDLLNGGKVLGGPSPRPVPQVLLTFDASSGDITAIGMAPPTIFGHSSGSNDVLKDLEGGTLVSGK